MMMKLLLATLSVAVAPGYASAQARVGGQFEMFDVAFQGNRIVGTYREEQGTGPTRSCFFSFSGTLRPDGRAAVTARGAGAPPMAGALSLKNGELTLNMPRVNTFNGCSVPQGEALTGSRTLTARWIDLARVTTPRARFRTTSGGKPSASYVVQGDVVGVLRRSGGAILVDYAGGEGRPKQGWLAAGEVRSLGQ